MIKISCSFLKGGDEEREDEEGEDEDEESGEDDEREEGREEEEGEKYTFVFMSCVAKKMAVFLFKFN